MVLNQCWIDRFDLQHVSKITSTHALFAQFIPHMTCFLITTHHLLTFLNNKREYKRIAYIIATHLCGYCVVVVLKVVLADNHCHHRPNSVSGHYAFYIFHMIVLYDRPNLSLTTHRLNPSHDSRLRQWVYYCFVLVSLLTLYDTYTLGYHSLKQILLGTLAGLWMWLAYASMRPAYTISSSMEGVNTDKLQIECNNIETEPNHGQVMYKLNIPLIVFMSFNIGAILLAQFVHHQIPITLYEWIYLCVAWICILKSTS